jgi:hypothetical protein
MVAVELCLAKIPSGRNTDRILELAGRFGSCASPKFHPGAIRTEFLNLPVALAVAFDWEGTIRDC